MPSMDVSIAAFQRCSLSSSLSLLLDISSSALAARLSVLLPSRAPLSASYTLYHVTEYLL